MKYTEEQLLEFRPEAHVPQPQVLDAFNQLVDEVTEELEKHRISTRRPVTGDSYIDEHGNERSYHHLNRRRGSRSGNKPNLKKRAEVVQDDDGWATLAKPKKSFGAEDSLDERNAFRESVKEMKVKPNNKNLGSSKAVDPRDTIADKHTTTFNAFEALGGSDDED